MPCEKCGCEITNAAKFCVKCGTKITPPEPPPKSSDSVDPTPPARADPPWTTGAVIAGVLVAAGVLFLACGRPLWIGLGFPRILPSNMCIVMVVSVFGVGVGAVLFMLRRNRAGVFTASFSLLATVAVLVLWQSRNWF